MALNVQKVQATLQDLVGNGPEIQGAALVTLDGLPLVSTLPADMDEERVSAMAAAMLSIGERIGGELQRGDVGRVFVEGKQGYCTLTSCGQEAVLLVLASAAAKQGLINLSIKQTIAELETEI